MIKVFYTIMLFLYLIGTVGGFGYLVYIGQWAIAIGVVATGYMAFFKARDYFNKLV